MIAAYKGIPTIVGSLDSTVEKTAMGAFYYACDGTTVYDNIIDMTDRKVRLLNFLALTGQAVNVLPDDLKALIKARIEGIKFDKIAKKLGCSMRTVFRYYEIALNSMQKYLDLNGYNEEWMDKNSRRDSFLGRIRDRVEFLE